MVWGGNVAVISRLIRRTFTFDSYLYGGADRRLVKKKVGLIVVYCVPLKRLWAEAQGAPNAATRQGGNRRGRKGITADLCGRSVTRRRGS